MLSKSQYERTVATFLVELNHLCREESDGHLRALPKLAPEIDGYLDDFRDLGQDSSTALRYAFAYVDEYGGANWTEVIDSGYRAYLLEESRQGGNPNSN